MYRKALSSTQEDPDKDFKKIDDGRAVTAMPIIRCKCGEEILLIPDVKAMSMAIENHITTHSAQRNYGSTDSLRDYLIRQIFTVAAQVRT